MTAPKTSAKVVAEALRGPDIENGRENPTTPADYADEARTALAALAASPDVREELVQAFAALAHQQDVENGRWQRSTEALEALAAPYADAALTVLGSAS